MRRFEGIELPLNRRCREPVDPARTVSWGSPSGDETWLGTGVAWPLVYPGYVHDTGPQLLIQLGRPR